MKRRFATLIALALAIGVMAPALAAPPGSSGAAERGPYAETLFYSGDGVIVLAGADLGASCDDVGFATQSATFVSPNNGGSMFHFSDIGSVMVFEDDAGVEENPELIFPWLDDLCSSADPQEPIASGDVLFTGHVRVDSNGVIHVHNGITGTVTTSQGDRVHLSTFAKVVVGSSGPELLMLRTNYGG